MWSSRTEHPIPEAGFLKELVFLFKIKWVNEGFLNLRNNANDKALL